MARPPVCGDEHRARPDERSRADEEDGGQLVDAEGARQVIDARVEARDADSRFVLPAPGNRLKLGVERLTPITLITRTKDVVEQQAARFILRILLRNGNGNIHGRSARWPRRAGRVRAVRAAVPRGTAIGHRSRRGCLLVYSQRRAFIKQAQLQHHGRRSVAGGVLATKTL